MAWNETTLTSPRVAKIHWKVCHIHRWIGSPENCQSHTVSSKFPRMSTIFFQDLLFKEIKNDQLSFVQRLVVSENIERRNIDKGQWSFGRPFLVQHRRRRQVLTKSSALKTLVLVTSFRNNLRKKNVIKKKKEVHKSTEKFNNTGIIQVLHTINSCKDLGG